MGASRLSIPKSVLFRDHGPLRPNTTRPHWPTLRGAYLRADSIAKLRRIANIIGIVGRYNTNLNKYQVAADGVANSEEDAFFGETRVNLRTEHDRKLYPIYLLWWVGNYYNGSVFHCGWQAPHHQAYDPAKLEVATIKHFHRVVRAMYYDGKVTDPDVHVFLTRAHDSKIIMYGGS